MSNARVAMAVASLPVMMRLEAGRTSSSVPTAWAEARYCLRPKDDYTGNVAMIYFAMAVIFILLVTIRVI